MDHDQQPGLIASHVAKALECFRNFEGVLSKATESKDAPEGAILNDILLQLENDFTRFKMWVGNQAAHQSGPSSLDYRLRESSHLQQQVIYLLKDICESWQTATSLVHNSPSSRKVEALQDDNSHSSPPDSGGSDESDFSDSDSDDLQGSGLPTLLTDIGEAVDCLLRLSVAIANPAPHERSRKLSTEPSESLSFCERYEPEDIAHVTKKFPSIASELAVALGRFITSRRQFFKNRQAHREKLASNKETDTYYTELIEEETLSDDEGSETTSAHRWFFEGTGQATLPLRPSATEDGIFECPFCYRMICAKSIIAWERHVFRDLRPYKCIDSSCIKLNSDFDRRRDWQSHVSKYHWRSWSCPFKCLQAFSVASELSSHIREYHLPTGTEEELKSIAALGERVAPDYHSIPCPLCEYPVTGLAEYIDHVSCHLEHLALFALPSLKTEDLNKMAGNNEKSNYERQVDADIPQAFSAIPPPVLGAHPRQSSESLGKGKEAASMDDAMSDIGTSHSHRRHRRYQKEPRTKVQEALIRVLIDEMVPAIPTGRRLRHSARRPRKVPLTEKEPEGCGSSSKAIKVEPPAASPDVPAEDPSDPLQYRSVV